jgi:hypothetical protein
MAESQIAHLQNARVLLEDARSQIQNLSETRRARLEASIGAALRGRWMPSYATSHATCRARAVVSRR